MAFPLKNHLKTGLRDESPETSQGNTRLCPTVASKLKGGIIILVGSMATQEEKKMCLCMAQSLYTIQANKEGNKA